MAVDHPKGRSAAILFLGGSLLLICFTRRRDGYATPKRFSGSRKDAKGESCEYNFITKARRANSLRLCFPLRLCVKPLRIRRTVA